jgi:tetratricopeptide (TPR) repeat protein
MQYLASSISSMLPPPTDAPSILQRADDVNTVLRMISERQTSVVVLTGDPGAGKSTLAALLYRRLQAFGQAGSPVARYFVWLGLAPHATLPDVIAAILNGLNISSPDFFLLKPEQQIALLVQALRRPQENAFIVLDQFEEFFNPETGQVLAGRGAIPFFLTTIQQDIGASCLLLTCTRSPYGSENFQETRVRSYMLSRISLPEGIALLQQHGVPGSPQELSIVWQRCAGHAFALVLFGTLSTVSGFSLSYLLDSPDYAPMWDGEVTLHLIGTVYYFLNPIQRTVMRALCLFSEPVPIQAIIAAITGENSTMDMSTFERELSTLINLALVQQSPNEKGRYTLHPLLRQYTIEHYVEGTDRRRSGDLTLELGVTAPPNPMQANPEVWQIALAAGHMRVVSYYQQLAQEYCPAREKRRGPPDIEPFLFVIRHLCLGSHWQQAYDLLFSEGLYESMVQWGACTPLIGLYLLMLPPSGILARRDEGQALSNLGLLHTRLGDSQQSIAYYQQALLIQREIGDLHGQVITLINLSELLRSQGQMRAAHATLEQAWTLNEQQPDALLESVLLHNLGLVYQAEKDYMQALRCYLESLRLAQRLQERYNEGMILTNSGMLLCEQGHLPEALSLLFSALQIRHRLQDPTVSTVILFLKTLEQKMGVEAFAHVRQAAQAIQGTPEQILSRLVATSIH